MARIGLAILRLTIGAMFVWVFFENLGEGPIHALTITRISFVITLITARLPPCGRVVMELAARHASMAAPLQGLTEISVGVLLVLGLFTRPGRTRRIWVPCEPVGFGSGGRRGIWELLVPVLASLALAVGAAGRTWGIDFFLARRRPRALWW